MIASDTQEQRKDALKNILPLQKKDFIGIFEAMNGRPVTIRLLDPPLHEFIPHTDKETAELAKHMKVNKKEYNKDEVRKFFKESRERIKEHKIDDRKEPLNSIIKAVEKMVHVVAIAEEISKEDKMEDDKMLEKHE